MRFEIQKGRVTLSPTLERVIARKAAKIERRLKTYHPDVAELAIRLVRRVKTAEYQCGLTLSAFKDRLHAEKTSAQLRTAVDRAFDAMLQELEAYRVRRNKSLQGHG